MNMARCVKCKKRLRVSTEEVQICSHCGFGQGDGLSDLSLVEPLEEGDQYNSSSKVQILGKIAVGVLVLLTIGVVVYAMMNPVEDPNVEDPNLEDVSND